MKSYLDDILAAKRRAAAADGRPLERLLSEAGSRGDVRPFAAELVRSPEVSVIAEVKRRSPSKGLLAEGLDPARLAESYADGGASCLSVLTDSEFFGGSASDLRRARDASGLPTMRKDFTVCEADVCDARIMGADAVLLIMAALSDEEVCRLLGLALELGMDALVEVHDELELARALDAGASLVGVNQRDLFSFDVDPGRAARLSELMPAGTVKVAESGISGRAEVEQLGRAGFDAVLVGEALVRSEDPGRAVASMLGVPSGAARPAPHHVQG